MDEETIDSLVNQATCLLIKFDPENIDFPKWLSMFELVVKNLKISGDKKVPFLLNMLEASVLNNLLLIAYPGNLIELSYVEIISVILKEYPPFHGKAEAEYRFNTRFQLENEKVEQYAKALFNLLGDCSQEFRKGDRFLKQFIPGLLCDVTRIHLIQESNLTVETALTIAKDIEKKIVRR